MSCYLRHLKGEIEQAGIELTKQNRKAVDELLHSYVRVKYKNCPRAWRAIKNAIRSDDESRAKLVAALRRKFA